MWFANAPSPARIEPTRGSASGSSDELELDVVDLADESSLSVDELTVEQLEDSPDLPTGGGASAGVRCS